MKQEHPGREAQESPGFSRGEEVKVDLPETVTLTPDVAAWLAGLVARQTIEIGHPEARHVAAMAWRALDQLTQQGDLNG